MAFMDVTREFCNPSNEDLGYYAAWQEADYFISASKAGFEKWGRFGDAEAGGHGEADGFVYFAVTGWPNPNFLKIGFTRKDPRDRIKSLQTGCPVPIALVGSILGNEGLEADLHSVLTEDRVMGEWFEYTERVERIVRNMLTDETVNGN